jgi:ketosteroid isomerase-like protein
MLRPSTGLGVLLALLTIAARGSAADGDLAAIRRARAAMNTAFNAHALSALAAFMTDTLTVSGPVWRLVGRQQVADASSGLLDRPARRHLGLPANRDSRIRRVALVVGTRHVGAEMDGS